MHLLAFQRIAADELAERICLVGRCSPVGAHFVQHHGEARFSRLEGGFATGQAGSDDVKSLQVIV